MPVATARKTKKLSESKDFRVSLKEEIGDLSGIEVYFNNILVATYIRPVKIGSIIRPDLNIDEDNYQGKVGLVLKKGPMAFKDDESITFDGLNVHEGDYVVYRVGDGWDVTVNGVACRMLVDRNIRMRVQDPEVIF